MQLSASTLPFDPASALPGGLPDSIPGLPPGQATPALDGFGALLSAETAPNADLPTSSPAAVPSTPASTAEQTDPATAEQTAWAFAMGFAPPAPRLPVAPASDEPSAFDADGEPMPSTQDETNDDAPAGSLPDTPATATTGTTAERSIPTGAPMRASFLIGRQNIPATPVAPASAGTPAPAPAPADTDASAPAPLPADNTVAPAAADVATPAPAPATATTPATANVAAPVEQPAAQLEEPPAAASAPPAAPTGVKPRREPIAARASKGASRARSTPDEQQQPESGQGSVAAPAASFSAPAYFATAAATEPTSNILSTSSAVPTSADPSPAPSPLPASGSDFRATYRPAANELPVFAKSFAAPASLPTAMTAAQSVDFASVPTPADALITPQSLPAAGFQGSTVGAQPVAVAPTADASLPDAPEAAFSAPSSATPAPMSVPLPVTAPSSAPAAPAALVSPLVTELPENFAAAVAPIANAVANSAEGTKKDLVVTDKDCVVTRVGRLGTNVAKNGANMPSLAPNLSRPTHDAATSAASAISPVLDFAALADEVTQVAPSSASSAHEAVESVLAVTDHFTTGGQHGVNLKFTVSGIDLAVRVEVRGGTVQTTFRTDSPELRAALATEWHAVTAETGARSSHLAEPVFTATAGSRDALQSDTGSLDQRGSQARHEAAAFADQPAFRGLSRRSAVPASSSAAVTSPAAPLASPGRLHVLA